MRVRSTAPAGFFKGPEMGPSPQGRESRKDLRECQEVGRKKRGVGKRTNISM